MKLIKARIRGTGKLRESQWFEVGPHLNLFQFPGDQGPGNGRSFLQILQSINPTYVIRSRQPFRGLPTHIDQNGHTRRINPAKKTIALAVFSATPELVRDLTPLGEWFYETDRIEVGRRFDYSRWINFVELASSTRWSEISNDVGILLAEAGRIRPDSNPPPGELDHLKPADRIIDQVQESLLQWLHKLPPELQQSSSQLIEKTITAVMRATHFQNARNIVRSRLPLFVTLGTDPELLDLSDLLLLISQRITAGGEQSEADSRTFLNTLNEQLMALEFSGMMLRVESTPDGILLKRDEKPVHLLVEETDPSLLSLGQMQAKAALAIAYSRIVCQTEPILLFSGPEQMLPTALHAELADFILKISESCQCLYCLSDIDIFPDDSAYRRYNVAENSLLPMPMDEHK